MFFIASFNMANRFADVRGVAPTTRVFVDDARRKILGDLQEALRRMRRKRKKIRMMMTNLIHPLKAVKIPNQHEGATQLY